MKIYIISKEPFPIGFAATNRIMHYAKGLVTSGADCEVVVMTRTEKGKIVNIQAEGVYEQVKYRYISGRTERESSFFGRRVGDFCDAIGGLSFLCKKVVEGDVVLWYVGRTWIAYTGLAQIICRIRGIRLVRELCELPYATANDSWYNRIKRWCYEKISMPRFDGFIAISEALAKYAHCVAKSVPQIKVPILVDVNQYDVVEVYAHNKPYIFHAGTMYERKDAIVSTMKAFAMASKNLQNKIDFILAGPESPHAAELQDIIETNGLNDNVKFLGSISHKEVLAYQKGATLSILNKNDNLQNRCGFSTKLGDVLLAGTPVITTMVGEANFFLKDGESAYICEPHNVDAIAKKIEQAFLYEDERIKIGLQGREIAKANFDCRIQGQRLMKFFESL